MSRPLVILAFLLTFGLRSSEAQVPEPRLVDSFERVPCGHMIARLDGLLAEWNQNRESRIAVVYAGHRYRKNLRRDRHGREVVILNPAHPDDGTNWAKGIPKYLLARTGEGEENRLLQDRITLIDGGYDEETRAEIWLVPPGASLPTASPRLSAKDIRFGAALPHRIPDYINCYSMYDSI